ncbi:MAG TPA: ornithine cyclodeaminase family protein [Candidatus Micrarchaeaceae archaeon]|nr:ornithine cyclodeaminase family protein [Candidatus Micrarchaeaceae archaeon]
MRVLMLSQVDVAALLDLPRLLDALEEGFRALSSGRVEVPARTSVTAEREGWLASMPGYGAGLGLGVKLVSVFPQNHSAGLPSHQALIALFDSATGSPMAVMDGTRITAIRTAGTAAVSVRHLARDDARVLAILGAGVQGHAHLEILPLVRNFEEIRIASRTIESARRLAERDPKAHAVATYEDAVRGADVVAMCTHSGTPVIRREWVGPGTHVSSVGFSAPDGELDRGLAAAASLFVESRAAAFSPPPVGCMELVGMDPNRATEMGELLLHARPGRQSADEITVYKSMGHAVEDLAASGLVYKEALAKGAGTFIEL